MRRQWRIAATAAIVGLLMLVSPTPVYSAELGPVQASITCANLAGETRTFQTGWNPTNTYFEGKGDIARLFCEGGHAGSWTIYVSDTLDPSDPRRYYNGIIPTPSPTPEPTPEPSSTPEPSLEPEPTPTPSLVPEITPEPTLTPVEPIQSEPTPEALVTPTQLPKPTTSPETSQSPTPTQSPEPTSEPTTSPTPIPSATIEPSPTPIISAPTEIEPTPTPTISQEITIELSPALEPIPGALQLVAAAEAIMNIGADMTDEQRDEAQAVAVSALIVTQLAQVRKIK